MIFRKKSKILRALFYIILFLLSGCSEYEDRLIFDIYTKKGKLCKTWKINEVILNNKILHNGDTIQQTENLICIYKNKDSKYTFEKNGKFIQEERWSYYDIIITSPSLIIITLAPFDSTWSFYNDKTCLITTYWGTDTCEIIKLKKNELWTKKNKYGNVYEFHYIPY